MGKKYGVSAGVFSKSINVGRLNKDRTAFLDKEDCTPEVLHAIADWVSDNYDGAAWVTIGDRRIDITVSSKDDSPADASTEEVERLVEIAAPAPVEDEPYEETVNKAVDAFARSMSETPEGITHLHKHVIAALDAVGIKEPKTDQKGER